MKDMKNSKFSIHEKAIHHLMLNSLFLKDFGLLQGKMGIVLFFYEYGRSKNEVVYSDFADDLLDDIWDKIHKRIPIHFKSGLTGIAWGIEYLIRNHFVEGNSNEICSEIDQYIMKNDIRRIIDREFIRNELEGFLHYILARFSGSLKQNQSFPFDPLFRNDLHTILILLTKKNKGLSITCNKQIDLLLKYLNGESGANYIPRISLFIKNGNLEEKKIYKYPLGLQEGLAGLLFNTII